MLLKGCGAFDADFSCLQDLVRVSLVDGNIVGVHVDSEAIYREDVKPNEAIDYFYRVRNLLVTLLDHVDHNSVNRFSFWEKKEPAEARSITRWATAGENEDTSKTSNMASSKFFRSSYLQARARDLENYYFGSFDAN
ncbi:hypothetical protein ATCC90586_010939 [Pythium insidiosum]|nr:hypothetical protein ATCC90586_010939 [Pythium insidiosum]